jgi:teichuronic acid biosynthesis glycosyltransferase TuaC
MKLLCIASIYPNPIQPAKGIFNDHLMRALAMEHEVSVVAPISWLDELRQRRRVSLSRPERRAIIHERTTIHYPRYYYTPKLLRSFYGWFYWRSVRSTVRAEIDRDPPDVVLGFWVHPDGEAAVRAAREAGVPSVVIVGGSDVLMLTKTPRRRRRVLDVLMAADVVVAVSTDLRDKIVDLGVTREKVHIWARGIDSAVFSRGDQSGARRRLRIPCAGRVLVWVGWMVPVKGLDVLLESCALLQARGVDYHLYLVGDGPLRKDLIAQSLAHGLSGRITFVGPKLHDELPDWYRAADITVLPSRSEGLPNVLRESLACGTPFVASDVGGIPEIAESTSCLLVPAENPQALADAIAQALERGNGLRALVKTEFQSWAKSANTLVEIIRSCVTSGPLCKQNEVGRAVSGQDRVSIMSANQEKHATLRDSVPPEDWRSPDRPEAVCPMPNCR